MNVQEAYNRWAEQYDDNANPTRDLNMQCLRRAAVPYCIVHGVLMPGVGD